MLKINSDLTSYVMLFLSNKDNISLIKTCKDIYRTGKKYGYINRICFNPNTNFEHFINMFCKHSHSIKEIVIERSSDPDLWIPKYTENISIYDCIPSGIIDPKISGSITKKITFVNKFAILDKQTLRINWKNFKNLEEINLRVYNVDLTGLEYLKKLKRISIISFVPIVKKIPNFSIKSSKTCYYIYNYKCENKRE